MRYLKSIYYIFYKFEKYNCRPRISAHAFSIRWRARFLFENDFLFIKKNDLESSLIFVLVLKMVNKIKKKTLSVTPYFGKGGL